MGSDLTYAYPSCYKISVGLIQYEFMLYARMLTIRSPLPFNFTNLNRSSDLIYFAAEDGIRLTAHMSFTRHTIRGIHTGIVHTPSTILRNRADYISFFGPGHKVEPQICECHMP